MNKEDFNPNDVNWTENEKELINMKMLDGSKKSFKAVAFSMLSFWCAAASVALFYDQKSAAASKEELLDNHADMLILNEELYPDTLSYERIMASEEKWYNEVRASVASHKNIAQWAFNISGLFALAGVGGILMGMKYKNSNEKKASWDVYQQRFHEHAREG